MNGTLFNLVLFSYSGVSSYLFTFRCFCDNTLLDILSVECALTLLLCSCGRYQLVPALLLACL